MKIAIDISQIVYGTGVSKYTENLVRNLLLLDKENNYLLYAGSLRRKNEIDKFINNLEGQYSKKVFLIPPKLADLIWNKLHVLPIENLIGKVDVFHSSDWTQPPTRAFKVTTIHDLVPIKFPKLAHPKIVSAHKRRLNIIKKEVDRVIVPSEATKIDLLDLGFVPEKIKVIPEAPDKKFGIKSQEEVEKINRKYRIGNNYIIAIGVNRRKNTERIIKAFEAVKTRENNKWVKNLHLCIIGHNYINIENKRGIDYLGHVSDNDLPFLYAGAKALVYPSFYEGFGLPVLEAFASQIPVVTSNISSLPEVAGDAAELVDPYSVESIAEGIASAMKNRNNLIHKGLVQVKRFSWEKTAAETLKIYKEVEK